MSEPKQRPPFIISSKDIKEKPGQYPQSDEILSYGKPIGKLAGLARIGLHIERLPPGHRTSYPHAEQNEEEFVYVLEGCCDAWVDGELYPMAQGDLAAFPAGTGICHTFINNSEQEVLLLVGGEAEKKDSKIFYPLNPERQAQLIWSNWWDDVPKRSMGPHDGRPNKKDE
jgi:uncharacterized cupin superfamily protein